MAKRPFLKLSTNLPLICELMYTDWFTGEHGSKCKYTVRIAPDQEHYPIGDEGNEFALIVPPWKHERIVNTGILQDTGKIDERAGQPITTPVPAMKGGKLRITQWEQDKARPWKLELWRPEDGGQWELLDTGYGDQENKAPEAAEGPKAPQAGTQPQAPVQSQQGTSPAAGGASGHVHPGTLWLGMGEAYALSAQMAAEALAGPLGCELSELDHSALQAATFSIFKMTLERGGKPFNDMLGKYMKRAASKQHEDIDEPEPKPQVEDPPVPPVSDTGYDDDDDELPF